jgi:hypothetical protein
MLIDLQRAAAATGVAYRRLRARLLAQAVEPLLPETADWRLRLAADALSLWRSAAEECVCVELFAAGMYRTGRGAYLGGAPSPWTRANDIVALGPEMQPRVVELLWFERAWSDSRELAALMMALTLFGDGRAVPALAALTGEHEVPDALKARAAETLGRLGHPAGMPALARLLADARAPAAARRAAARWLGIRGVREAASLLARVAGDVGEEEALREDALDALRRPYFP